MTWVKASAWALAIFAYFVVTTVVIPDYVLQIDAVADASSVVRDLVVLVVWGGALGAGVWLLRRGQRRGLI
jgi:hypothetical protein